MQPNFTDGTGDFVSNLDDLYLQQVLQRRQNELIVELITVRDFQTASRLVTFFNANRGLTQLDIPSDASVK